MIHTHTHKDDNTKECDKVWHRNKATVEWNNQDVQVVRKFTQEGKTEEEEEENTSNREKDKMIKIEQMCPGMNWIERKGRKEKKKKVSEQ